MLQSVHALKLREEHGYNIHGQLFHLRWSNLLIFAVFLCVCALVSQLKKDQDFKEQLAKTR
jgi:hypothetical protein